MSDNEVASMPEEAVDGPLDPAAVAALTAPVPETIGDGGPELVQLLTPEGERVEHPDYDDVRRRPRRRGPARLLPRHGPDPRASTPRRPRCSARASSASGPSCSARRPRRSAPAARCARRTTSSRPTASTASPGAAASTRCKLLGLFRGVNHGGWDPNENNFHLYTIVIGAQTLHATGYAMGMQRDGDVGTGDPDRDAAVIAYFGDGATSQGDVNEAFIFAASYNAPVVFFCQNNQWAISEPIERQTRIPLYQRAPRLRLPRRPRRRQRRARRRTP